MLPRFLLNLISHILSFTPSHVADQPPGSGNLHFELRHHHAVSSSSRVVFADVPPNTFHTTSTKYHNIQTRRIKTHRPRSAEYFNEARIRSMRFGQSLDFPWDPEDVIGPDVESRETLLLLAKMTNNAYIDPEDAQWYDLGGNWTVSYPFGWEPDADGFRGHVFATPDNSTVVLSIKGTSAGVFGGGGPTVKKDKFNDNLLFSCCCARVDWTWTTVCGCYSGGWKCDIDCLQRALVEESLFYPIGTNLYNNITYMYPDSTIWITGHSLGGALGSLLGVTFGAPVVSFESPGDRMAASRLHLPSPPSTQHITHVYHTADPIAMGTCNGVLSSCALGGYAMESRCHLGTSIIYDTVSNLSWSVDVRTHGIVAVIDKILSYPWDPALEVGREVPEAVPDGDDCVEGADEWIWCRNAIVGISGIIRIRRFHDRINNWVSIRMIASCVYHKTIASASPSIPSKCLPTQTRIESVDDSGVVTVASQSCYLVDGGRWTVDKKTVEAGRTARGRH